MNRIKRVATFFFKKFGIFIEVYKSRLNMYITSYFKLLPSINLLQVLFIPNDIQVTNSFIDIQTEIPIELSIPIITSYKHPLELILNLTPHLDS